MPLFVQCNAVNASNFPVHVANFPVKRRYRRYFSGSAPLTPLIILLNAVNAAIFPVQQG